MVLQLIFGSFGLPGNGNGNGIRGNDQEGAIWGR